MSRHSFWKNRLLVAGAFLLGLGFTQPIQAATLVVNSPESTDGNTCGATCTLRQAINTANANEDSDTIMFDPVVFASKQTILGGLPEIESNINIIGPTALGSGVTLCRDGVRVNASQCAVSLSNLNVIGERTDVGLLVIRGHVTLTNCTFTGNSYAIFNLGLQHTNPDEEQRTTKPYRLYGVVDEVSNVTANNCTIVGNTYGAYNDIGTLEMNSCTVANNEAGILGRESIQILFNCLVVGNKRCNIGDAYDTKTTFRIGQESITTGTAEEVGLDPGGLRDNGGPTQTIALTSGSLAIDKGHTTIETDQRGLPRPKNEDQSCDVGAFQTQGGSSSPVSQ